MRRENRGDSIMWLISQSNLEVLIEKWHQANDVFIPTLFYGDVLLMPYEKHKLTLDYINFAQPVKEFFFKGREKLFNWKEEEGDLMLSKPKTEAKSRILFGIRACDVHAIQYMDRFYQGEFCDDIYKQNRERTMIIALNCVKTGSQCFCDSVQSGPFSKSGYDLLFTPMDENYLIEAGTEAGLTLMESVAATEIEHEKDLLESKVKKQFKKVMNSKNPQGILAQSFDHPIWEELAAKCIRCGGCTNVCPTCTCYNVIEEKTAFKMGTRVRSLDSCQSDSFTTNAGGHKTRNDISRVRYRIYDKLKYIEERFGYKGCTGCGRCIAACPVDIDIVSTLNRIESSSDVSASSDNHFETSINNDFVEASSQGHQSCEETYMPHVAVIKEIVEETRNIKRFYLEYEDLNLHDNFELKGQFFEITVFGVGEIAISIPFASDQSKGFDFCIKNVGKVTGVLHKMKVGDKVGLRGPFGKGFPVEEMKGRDLLIIGSGVGVAPVRTAILQVAEKRSEYGKIVIIGSALTYEDLIYKEDFIKWSEDGSLDVQYALNKPTDVIPAFVGRINELLPNLSNDWRNTTAIICASPNRIREIAKDLIKLGMSSTQIFTSLETHMRCGIGKCGHCKVGNKYMCVDGPVFNYEEMLALPPEF